MDLEKSIRNIKSNLRFPAFSRCNASFKKIIVSIAIAIACFWTTWLLFASPSGNSYGQYINSSIQSAKNSVVNSVAKSQPQEPLQVPSISEVIETHLHEKLPYYNATEYLDLNSTLGFGKIYYINLANRHDNEDSLQIQASLTGLEMHLEPALSAKDISFKGLPLSSHLNYMNGGKAGMACYRSHANVWRRMLKENLDSALILEADAAWDMDIKPMMSHYSQALAEMMRKFSFIRPEVKPTQKDPYLSQNWDILHFGGCFENANYENVSMPYYDPYVGGNGKYFKQDLAPQTRMIRFQPEQMCTTGYAVSRAGAMKLLIRAAFDLNTPVDGLLAETTRENKTRAFGIWPNPFVQWVYKNNLSNGFQNSNMGNKKPDLDPNTIDTEAFKKAWRQAYKSYSVWDYSGMYNGQRFKNPALFNLKEHVYKDSLDF